MIEALHLATFLFLIDLADHLVTKRRKARS
jgi:hypothetical protein